MGCKYERAELILSQKRLVLSEGCTYLIPYLVKAHGLQIAPHFFFRIVEHGFTSNFSKVYVLLSAMYADAAVLNRSRGRTRPSFYEGSRRWQHRSRIRFFSLRATLLSQNTVWLRNGKNNNTKITKMSFVIKKSRCSKYQRKSYPKLIKDIAANI